ncbi:MAG: class I SAM-dependent methyltransferase [Bacteroidales bacterium]|nr:class I SAM-dependent methyltransferase [Bacteroidales bacterium]
MQKRHKDRFSYFQEQVITTKKHVIPFVSEYIDFGENTSVLEIGCGEGGNLKPFVELKCKVVGIDMNANKIKNANVFFEQDVKENNIQFIQKDIYDADDLDQFDFIFLRDVLEHIHNQERFINYVVKFLKPNGFLFLGFPPFQNPFGGHQQICKSKVLALTPYYHNLPTGLYRRILKWFGESDYQIENLIEVKQTGITIERFYKIVGNSPFEIIKQTFYLINPNYQIKFGLKPRVIWKPLSKIPYLRNYIITTNYFLLKKRN